MQVTDVTLISAAVLDAVASRAPQAPRTDTDILALPSIEEAETQTPAADTSPALESSPEQNTPSVEPSPDLAGIAQPPDAAEVPETALAAANPEPPDVLAGNDAVLIEGLVQPEDSPITSDALALAEPPQPRDAPRIDTTAAPKPPSDAERSDTALPEVVADEISIEPEEERAAEAPVEATTEIGPEPAEDTPESSAPKASARPRRRPADLLEPVSPPAATEIAKAPDNRAAEPADPAPGTEPPAATQSASTRPVGPPLTGREIDGLRLAIKNCWSVPAGLRNAEELEVVVGVTLSVDGEVVGNAVRWIEPSDQSDARFKSAFRAARTAILRCQPYEMPREKYAQWKNLEVVFNPSGMKGLY